MGTGKHRRRRVEPTADWEQLELLCVHDEQVEYERIRPLVLFGEPAYLRMRHAGVTDKDVPDDRHPIYFMGLWHA